MKFLNDFIEVGKTKNRLPHWQQDGASFFVTWRLGDSIPKKRLDQWFAEKEEWLAKHPKPWIAETEAEFHRVFSMEMEVFMDQGHGSCPLRRADCREVLRNVLFKYEAERFSIHSLVIMPNHVHILFTLGEGQCIEGVIQGWKRVSAIGVNRVLQQKGNVWQKDYFDTMIRSWEHMVGVARYIRKNPSKAKLREGDWFLWESDLVKRLLA